MKSFITLIACYFNRISRICKAYNLNGNYQVYDYRCCFINANGILYSKHKRDILASSPEKFYRHLLKRLRHEDESSSGTNFTTISVRSSGSVYEQILSKVSGCKLPLKNKKCNKNGFNKLYRTEDGTCNNFHHTTWGAAPILFRRFLHSRYANGINKPFGWGYSSYLPSPRLISNRVISTRKIKLSTAYTDIMMHWGQFVDHDLTLTLTADKKIEGICGKTCKKFSHCFPIPVSKHDSKFGCDKCLHFTRAAAACGTGLTSIVYGHIRPREQINGITSFIDASNVYGSSKKESRLLRKRGPKGLLKTGKRVGPGKFLLPFAKKGQTECQPSHIVKPCFLAGDKRVNVQIGLTAIHTIWVREHNRIAKRLARINPNWKSNRIYQEARKIVIAQNQHIIFQRYLRKLLGAAYGRLIPDYYGYKKRVDPSIIASFAAAAFRIGHTLINPVLHRLNSSYLPIPEGNIRLKDAFFAPHRILNEGGIDPILRGITGTYGKLKTPNTFVSKEVTDHLFEVNDQMAMDLAALNIQRGRDFGLPSYNTWRKRCGLRKAKRFSQLSGEIDSKTIAKLAQVYDHPNDIDLWVGGISEMNVHRGVMGPTFACIIAKQFVKIRDGDRFWYEKRGVFTPSQLRQIKKSSLARVICDNSDDITQIQKDVFRDSNAAGNAIVDCSTIPRINLRKWKD